MTSKSLAHVNIRRCLKLEPQIRVFELITGRFLNAAKTLSATLAAQILADNHFLYDASADYLFEGKKLPSINFHF